MAIVVRLLMAVEVAMFVLMNWVVLSVSCRLLLRLGSFLLLLCRRLVGLGPPGGLPLPGSIVKSIGIRRRIVISVVLVVAIVLVVVHTFVVIVTIVWFILVIILSIWIEFQILVVFFRRELVLLVLAVIISILPIMVWNWIMLLVLSWTCLRSWLMLLMLLVVMVAVNYWSWVMLVLQWVLLVRAATMSYWTVILVAQWVIHVMTLEIMMNLLMSMWQVSWPHVRTILVMWAVTVMTMKSMSGMRSMLIAVHQRFVWLMLSRWVATSRMSACVPVHFLPVSIGLSLELRPEWRSAHGSLTISLDHGRWWAHLRSVRWRSRISRLVWSPWSMWLTSMSRWLVCSAGFVSSSSTVAMLLIPVVWKVEVDVDVTTIEVVIGAYCESDIFADLPSHIVFGTL